MYLADFYPQRQWFLVLPLTVMNSSTMRDVRTLYRMTESAYAILLYKGYICSRVTYMYLLGVWNRVSADASHLTNSPPLHNLPASVTPPTNTDTHEGCCSSSVLPTGRAAKNQEKRHNSCISRILHWFLYPITAIQFITVIVSLSLTGEYGKVYVAQTKILNMHMDDSEVY